MESKTESRVTQYRCICAECQKRLFDPRDNPIYVVVLDKYFCSEKCWDTFRKRE